MDHGLHSEDHDMSSMCSMNMLFTWSTQNLCIIFPAWRITTTASLIWSLLAIVALTAGYELVREVSRKVESSISESLAGMRGGYKGGSGDDSEEEATHSLLARPAVTATTTRRGASRTLRGVLYAAQVFYSFFIM
ncbi:MAG: hypothetical protein M1828_004300 [Chrysothrix sp. TS-e1954]|nr:MAG: hypothetical protein M1828_004300 [Chrysothrix sp. TS-e1954]